MDPFQIFPGQYNPQIYGSSNVPPSTDRLFSLSGFQAGLMTNQSSNVPPPSSRQYQQEQQLSSQQQQQFTQLHQPRQSLSKPPSNSISYGPHVLISAPPPPPPLAPPVSVPSNTRNDSGRYSGMYANTGFDMLSILSRVTNR
jgi:hypothetical protein